MHVFYQGHRVDIRVKGTSKVQSIDGPWQVVVDLEPVIPRGPGGPGEPVQIPRAA